MSGGLNLNTTSASFAAQYGRLEPIIVGMALNQVSEVESRIAAHGNAVTPGAFTSMLEPKFPVELE